MSLPMLPIVIHADRALTPFEEISDAVVVIRGSKISAVGRRGKSNCLAARERSPHGERPSCRALSMSTFTAPVGTT